MNLTKNTTAKIILASAIAAFSAESISVTTKSGVTATLYGFASLNKQNAQFVSDFLSLFDETNHVYFSVSSKIEYLVLQLFQGYNNNLLVDADLMKYSITKALVIYRPQEIIRCLCLCNKEQFT